MTRLIASITAFLALTAGSIAHGRDWGVSKGLLVAVTCLILAGITWWMSGVWYGAGIGAFSVLWFWFARRNSAEAHASLSEIDFPERHDTKLFKAQRWVSLASSILLSGLCIYLQAWWWLPVAIIAPWLSNLALFLFVPLVAQWVIDRPYKRMWTEGVFGAACSVEGGLFMWFGSKAVGAVSGWIG